MIPILSSISDAVDPTIIDSTGYEVANYYFTDDAALTLTCKITAGVDEYTLAWFENGMYNVAGRFLLNRKLFYLSLFIYVVF